MLTVPLGLAGVLPMLYFTGTAINVQSLLGIIFIVGIKVANTVLMTDFAQELRRHEGLTPTEAIRKAASIRVRPVTMTALAAFFAMIPAALALERGSEANAPLARAILGGLLAGEPATLFVLPCLYSLMVRDKPAQGRTPATTIRASATRTGTTPRSDRSGRMWRGRHGGTPAGTPCPHQGPGDYRPPRRAAGEGLPREGKGVARGDAQGDRGGPGLVEGQAGVRGLG